MVTSMSPSHSTANLVLVDGPCIGAAPFGFPSTLYSINSEPLFYPRELAGVLRRWPSLSGYHTSSGKIPVSRLLHLQFPVSPFLS